MSNLIIMVICVEHKTNAMMMMMMMLGHVGENFSLLCDMFFSLSLSHPPPRFDINSNVIPNWVRLLCTFILGL